MHLSGTKIFNLYSRKKLYIILSLLHIHKVIRKRAIKVQRFLFRSRTKLRSIKLCRLLETTQTILRSWGRIRTPWIGIEAIAEEYVKIHFIALLSLNAPFRLRKICSHLWIPKINIKWYIKYSILSYLYTRKYNK